MRCSSFHSHFIFYLFLFFTTFSLYASPDSLQYISPNALLLSPDSNYLIIDSIVISGNKRTKNFIIERELTFALHDTIYRNALQEEITRSEKNILNTSLFLSAEILFEDMDGHTICYILVEERWYIFPRFYFSIADRNFNVWWVEHDHELSRVQYGASITWYNFTGNKDNLGLEAVFGYTQKFGLSYTRPYLFKHSDFGGGFAISYANNKQLAYSTIGDKHVFYKDTAFVIQRFSSSIQVNKRTDLYQHHLLKLKYHDNRINDSVAVLNPDYFLNDGLNQQFFSLSYTYALNHIHEKSYPLNGDYAEFQIAKIGLGLLDKINQLYVAAQYNKYFELSPRLFLQGQAAAQFLTGTTYPYYELISLGYCENFVRGYEYYVIDGQQTYLVRTNLKWNLFNLQFRVPLIHWAVFDEIPIGAYLKLFSDAGYVADKYYSENNFLTNTMQYSVGAGLDLTTYYDWVFRFETAVNAMGEFGFYLHLGLDLNTYEDCNLW